MKALLRSIVLCTSALSLTACSSMMGGNLVEDNQPVGRITIVNNSGIAMNVVTLSKCSAMSHGMSRLNGGETIPSGYSRSWTVNAGCWDIGVGRSGACSGGSCSWHEAYDKVEVRAGQTAVSRWGSRGAN